MDKKKKTPSIEENLSKFADSGNARNSSVAKFMANINASPSRKNTVNGRRRRKDKRRVEDKPRYMIDWENTDLNSMRLPRSQGLDIYSGSDFTLTQPNDLLLDTYSGASAAYSLRKLRTTYTGDAIRVRESGGDTEADIGFNSNGDLDTVALLAHCGANDGFVVTWYDQSGNRYDVTQPTVDRQPRIVAAGIINTQNSSQALDFGVANNANLFNEIFTNSTAISSFFTVTKANTAGVQVITDSIGLSQRQSLFINNTPSAFSLFNGTTANSTVAANTNFNLHSSFIDTTSDLFMNGNQIITSANTGSQTRIGFKIGAAPNNAASFSGNILEVIVYDGVNKILDRPAIEININNYYTIY